MAQLKNENVFVKWGSWALLQAIPSPQYFEDKNDQKSGIKFGLEWQVIPLSYSFNTNKYVTPVSFFHIRPVKRFSGSAELFFEPAIVTGSFKNAGLEKFMYKTGARVIIPAAHRGEYLAFSFGAGYYMQKSLSGKTYAGISYEGAVYTLFGMLGLKFNYNRDAPSAFNFGLYLKYY